MFAKIFDSIIDFDDGGATQTFTSLGRMATAASDTVADASKKLLTPPIGATVAADRLLMWARFSGATVNAASLLEIGMRVWMTRSKADSQASSLLTFNSGIDPSPNILVLLDNANSNTPWDVVSKSNSPWQDSKLAQNIDFTSADFDSAHGTLDGIPFPIPNNLSVVFNPGSAGDVMSLQIFVLATIGPYEPWNKLMTKKHEWPIV